MNDYDKELILKTILKTTFIMIIISIILKLLGHNIFKLDLNNEIVKNIYNIIVKFKSLDYILGFIFLYLDYYLILKFSTSKGNKIAYYIGTLNLVLINLISQTFIFNELNYNLYPIFNLITIIFMSSIINKKINILRPIITSFFIMIYQIISIFIRNITFNDEFLLMYDFLLIFDYMILMIISYYLYLKKGSEFKWIYLKNYLVQAKLNGAYLFSDLKTTLSNFQKKCLLFSNSKRNEKAFVIIYLILFAISELFNITVIIFVAFLNNTIIECLFILSSFLITKKVFGDPFHFSSASKCFIVSNLSYYVLNKITFSIGISMVVPISLGVFLSYLTSLFVKNNEKQEIFRGIKEENLNMICKQHNLNTFETELLIDFYANKMTLVKLSHKYNYSKDAIWKKKKIALDKINRN